MLILAIETATDVLSVAVADENRVYAEYTMQYAKEHSRRLMPVVAEMLENLNIKGEQFDYLAVSSGPGSFTGLRIGMTTAKSLAQVWNIPVLPVPTLDALAFAFTETEAVVCPVLNAQRGEFYRGLFQHGRRLKDYSVANAGDMEKYIAGYEQVIFCGEAEALLKIAPHQMRKKCIPALAAHSMPRAANVAGKAGAMLAEGCILPELFSIVPLYIRKSEAEVKYEEKCRNNGG